MNSVGKGLFSPVACRGTRNIPHSIVKATRVSLTALLMIGAFSVQGCTAEWLQKRGSVDHIPGGSLNPIGSFSGLYYEMRDALVWIVCSVLVIGLVLRVVAILYAFKEKDGIKGTVRLIKDTGDLSIQIAFGLIAVLMVLA